MARRTGRKQPPTRFGLALRGVIGSAIVVALIVYTTVASTGALSGYPQVTAAIPASNAGVTEQSAVEYKGVVVGKVIKVETAQSTSTITMRIYDRQADGISSAAQVRVLPRTLFGDQFVQLVPPPGNAGKPIETGDTLRADTSEGTVQLYEAYVRLTDLLQRIEPAKIATALSAVSQLLDGRGEKFGRMIDQLYELTDDVPKLLALVDDGMEAASTLSSQLAAATLDGIKAMRDAIAISETVVAERRTLEQLLTSGITLTGEGKRFLGDNTDRFIELMHASGPVIDTLARNPQGTPEAIRSARRLLEKGIPTFQTGPWFRIRANLTTEEPRLYTTADCPRYGAQAGPNCGSGTQNGSARTSYGGDAGPVGSEQEKDTLSRLMRAAPNDLGSAAANEEASGAVGVLLGPLFRGTRVTTR
ncbi:MAG: MCE family protein [Actinophytocola sp.]|nr:MCE family protein [Actinophytocola sp.]